MLNLYLIQAIMQNVDAKNIYAAAAVWPVQTSSYSSQCPVLEKLY